MRLTALAVGVVWLPILLVWGPAPFSVTFDDAYYYFQIGREIAHGHGSSFNGLDHTNGYHPLWQAICVVPFLVGVSGLAAVRFLLVAQLMMWVATVAIVVGLVRPLRRAAAMTVGALALLVGTNPYVVKIFVNGLESGLAALVYAGLLTVMVDGRRRWLAPLLVLAFLARTDAAIVIGCLFVWMYLTERVWRPFVPAGVVVALYLLVNRVVFGEPLQVSGVVKRLPLTAGRVLTLLVVVAVAVLVAIGARRMSSNRFHRTAAFIAATGWFAAACILLVGYYRVLSVEVYLWYYAPIALYLIVVLLHVAADFTDAAVAEGQSLAAVRAILVVPFVLAFLFGGRLMADPQLRSLQEGDRATAQWVRDNTPSDTVIASWDAGIVGYFSARPVVNLDGVVNSFEWKDASHHAPVATRRFLEDRHVTLIVNHGELVNGEDPDIRRNVEALWGPGVTVTQLHREEYVYAGTAGGRTGTRRMATFVYRVEN